MSASRPPREERRVQRFNFARAVMMVGSGWVWVGSAFRRTVPVRRKGSCGMAIRRCRIREWGGVGRGWVSIVMVPEVRSRRRRRARRREDLPLVGAGGEWVGLVVGGGIGGWVLTFLFGRRCRLFGLGRF